MSEHGGNPKAEGFQMENLTLESDFILRTWKYQVPQ